MEDAFLEYLREVSEEFQHYVDLAKRILIVSHIDADGLSSAALMLKYLYDQDKIVQLKFFHYLDKKAIDDILSVKKDMLIFLDMGSGYIEELRKYFSYIPTFIIDHHQLVSKEKKIGKIFQINPRIFKIDGSKEISSSGVTYLLLKNLSYEILDYGWLALVGAIGDIQEDKKGFRGLNKKILEELQENGIIEVKKGLRMFGLYTRPLHKVLEYSTEIYIPEVTGSETGALQFLQEIGIPLKKGGDWIKYSDLNEEQIKKLITAIILKRMKYNIPNAEDVIGYIYLLKNSSHPFFKDLREIAYILNATGRMGKPSVGIASVLGDEKYKDQALDILLEYKKEILKALENIENVKKIVYKDILIFYFEKNLRPTLTSPVASILSFRIKDKRIIGVAADEDGTIKISIRLVNKNDSDLGKAVEKAALKVGGVGGGHDIAAGASIPKEKLEEFLKELYLELKRLSIII